jgi:hypothetical protein
MNDENRVLVRKGARNLTPEEAEKVTGGFRTLTVCSIGPSGQRDGDTSLGEC